MASALMPLLNKRGKLQEEGDALLKAAAEAGGLKAESDELTRLGEIETEMGEINALVEATHRSREWERNAPGVPAVDPEEETARPPSLGKPDPKAFKGPRPFAGFGDQLKAIHAAATGQGTHPGLTEIKAAAQGAGEAIPADGGFLVQQDFVSAIELGMVTGGQILSRVRRIPVTGNGLSFNVLAETDRATGSRWGSVRGYWVDEGDAPTASRPKFRKVELTLKKIAALGYASDELLEDAAAMTAIFTESFANELRFLVEDAVYEGDGAGKPAGFTHANNLSLVSVTKETNQAASTVVAQNVMKMRSRLFGPSRANSVWLINQDIEPQLQQMTLAVGTGGVPVYMPASGLSEDGFDRLYGRPVIPIEYASTLGTVGDIVLCDPSQYILIDKGGVRQATSMHVAFTTEEQAFRASLRVDGQSAWANVLTPFKGTGNTLSPWVALATRA